MHGKATITAAFFEPLPEDELQRWEGTVTEDQGGAPSKTTVSVRRARAEDRAIIRAFLDALQEHERSVDPSKLTAAEATPAYLAEIEAEIAGHDGAAFIAELDGRAVGFTACWRDHDGDVSIHGDWRDFGYVSDIYVAPEARGRGIARKLYQAAEDHCAARGLKRMRIGAINRNALAMASHRRFGFEPLYTVFDKPIGPAKR